MNDTLPISQVRNELPSLVDDVSNLSKTVYITVKGKVKAAIVSAEELNLLQETLEVLSDPTALQAIKEAEADVDSGHTISWENAKTQLKL